MLQQPCQHSLDEYNRYSNVGATLILQDERFQKGTYDIGTD
jgi:hypothetical protein